MNNFTADYLAHRPVQVVLPNGGWMFVIGLVGWEKGVSFADDGVFDEMSSGHPPLHHLIGKVRVDGPALVCKGHRFEPVTDPQRWELWQVMMRDKKPVEERIKAERALRRELIELELRNQ